MSDIEERVAALLKSPLGCAFLIKADASGLTPREIAEPVISLYLAAYAANDTEVWRWGRGNRDRWLKEVLQRGAQHADLARALLEEPAAAWWFGPQNRDQQVWVPRDGTPPDPAWVGTPQNPPAPYERYTPTSTLVQGVSSMFAALDWGTCDIGIGFSGPPWASWRLQVPHSARIFEVDGPLTWHDLCLRYPAEVIKDPGRPDFSGDDGQLEPNWSAVAADWDGVHLTFGGWLTSEQVRIESPAGWTYHWDWEAEQTKWLRWLFTASERMPDHERISPFKGWPWAPVDLLIGFRPHPPGSRGQSPWEPPDAVPPLR